MQTVEAGTLQAHDSLAGGSAGASVRRQALADEAQHCRRSAQRYEGRPEQHFLLKAAAALDELAYGPDERHN